MQFDFYIKRNHLFKKRRISYKTAYLDQPCREESLIYSPKQQRFEFIYLRFIRRFLRRKSLRQRLRFFRPYIWMGLRVNMVLSSKSKNSRMGAGVGLYVRLCTLLYAGTLLFILRGLTRFYILGILKRLVRRVPLKFIAKFNYFYVDFA